MTPEQWQWVKRLFEEALAYDGPEAQDAFLEEACGGDDAVLAAVRGMLQGDAHPPNIMQASLTELAAAAAGEDGPEGLPDRVGPYRPLREIGRGGMGVVYLAERDDDQYRRRVALKRVRAGNLSYDAVVRFRTERQILADLEHPNIARLYDGGLDQQGRPYLAMSYVEGRPIDVYCDAERLDVEARLKLFTTVCAAVGYAHRKLVVHRDLKPANVLVTSDGDVKLLDFGIAKLLDDEPGAAADRTRTGMRLLTPAYAAPEQIRGEPISTATDVFALGVMLYELLTGRRPFASEASSSYAAERAVLERDPTKPSTVVTRVVEPSLRDDGDPAPTAVDVAAHRSTTPSGLRRRLRGDLDRILLKALRKDPERRYTSAEAFVDDLRRHLKGLPVEAQPDTASYRARKFVRRHRFGVAVAVGFTVLLSGFAVLMTIQQRQTAQERDMARYERDKAERVVAVFSEMFEAADPGEARGDTVTVYEALSRSEARIDTALAGQPEIQAALYAVLGRVYQSLGRYPDAQARLEEALRLQRRQFEGPRPETANTLSDLARLAELAGDYEAAEAFHRDALAMRRELFGDGDPKTIENLNGLAALVYHRGDLDEAVRRFEELLDVNRRIFGARHLNTASVLNDLGAVYKQLGEYEKAEPLLREALEVRTAALGDDHPDVLTTGSNVASLLSDRGDPANAEPLFRRVLSARLRVLGASHPKVALTRTGLAVALQRMGKFVAAEKEFRAALAINRERLGPDHPTVGMDMAVLAGVLERQERFDEADPLYENALAIFRDKLPSDHPVIAMALLGLGRIDMAREAYSSALPLLEESVHLRSAGFGSDDWRTAEAQRELGACLTGLGRFEAAEALLTKTYRRLRAELGDADDQTTRAREVLAQLYERWGKPPPTDLRLRGG